MKSDLAIALCILAGCALPPAPTKQEMASFRAENTQLGYDDPRPMFKALFPYGTPLRKEELETQGEYKARLQKLGYEGKEFTFLIAPKYCKIMAYPDKGFYVISADETFYMGYDALHKPYGITIDRIDEEPRHYVGQNAYGATAEVSSYSATIMQIAPVDFLSLPRPLRWTDGDSTSFGRFGLPIRIADPAFRQKLKEQKIGLAVRVRVADLAKMDFNLQHSSATITDAVGLSYTKPLLPVVLLDAWIVDIDTNISLVHWRGENG